MDPCSIRGEGTLKWRFMKKEELKQDPIADKLLGAIKFSKKNSNYLIFGIFVILVIVAGLGYLQNKNQNYQSNSRLAIDEVMIQLINEGLNNPDYFETTLNSQIDSIYKMYPESKYINYLGFILAKESISDSSNTALIIDKINIMKHSIGNHWFKTQAFLIAGDYYSDELNFNLALKEYEGAIKYAQSNAQKGYVNYKLGNTHFELKQFEKALNSFQKASAFFDLSKKSPAMDRNQQFSSWSDRNSVALYKVKNILKK